MHWSTARTCWAAIAPWPTRAAGTRRRRASCSTTPAAERRVLWVKGSGTDLATITRRGFAALRLDEVQPLRSRETMDDATMVDYLLRCALDPDQPRPSIETLLHAFVERGPRGSHASRRGHRADLVAGRQVARRGSVRRRGRLARLPAARLRHVEADRGAARRESRGPRRAARAPRARHLGRRRRGGLQEHHRVRRESCRDRRQDRCRQVRSRRCGERGARGERVPGPPGADAPRAPRLAPRRRGRRRARGRPQPRGRGLRLVGARARGQPGRRSVPRPPDLHEAQAPRRRVRSRDRGRGRARRVVPTRCRGVRRLVPRVLRASTSTTRPAGSRSTRSARASRSSRESAS